MRIPVALCLAATALVAQSSPVIQQPQLAGVLEPPEAAQFLLAVHGFSATQLAYAPVPHPALRAGAATILVPDPLLCSASYIGAEVAQLVFAAPQGPIVLIDASSSLALHVLAVPSATWSLPAGICIDGEREQVVLLDAAEPRLLRIDLANVRAGKAKFESTPLPSAWSTVRGIAFDVARDRIVGFEPATGDLLQHSATDPNPSAGTLRPVPAVLAFGFAPSESPEHDLFITSGDQRMLTSQWTWSAAGIDVLTATLRATVPTGSWSPSSPDPSGIAYDPLFDRLIVSDGEVDEMPIYAGANAFEPSRTGILARTSATLAYTPEPSGITLDTATRTFYITDDDRDRVYVVGAGPDGLLNTADDSVRSFSVRSFSLDAEDVAFDQTTGELWLIDGGTSLAFKINPGLNGILDGVAGNGGDDVLTSYDLAQFGATDPEGIAIRPSDGGIYVAGLPKTLLLHLDSQGQLVRGITLPSAGLLKPAGIVFAPSTVGAGDSLFLVDRGVDNDFDPNENDGMLFEYGLPTEIPSNTPPVVDAGPDTTAVGTSAAFLAGTAIDDGAPGSPLMIQWSQLSGPGTANFTTPTQAATTVWFTALGTYVCQLRAFDGQAATTDTVTITVQAPPPAGSVERAVGTSSDDAEEGTTSVNRTSTDLELTIDGTVTQTVGIRFQSLALPAGAFITSAYVQFTCDEPTTTATQVTIAGQASDNAPTFTTIAGSISSRPRTTATVGWTPVAWNVLNEAGPDQRTPDLATVVQEIVSRPGWSFGNSMVFVITGTGRRIAAAYDRSPAVAAKLVVEYQTSPPANQPPAVNAGPDVSTVITSPAHLEGAVADDGLPGGPLAIEWTLVSGPGTATFTAPTLAVTDVTFSATGTYTCRCSAFDGELLTSDTVVVTVTEPPINQAPVVNAGSDVTTLITSPAQLSGIATDDGLPSGTLAIQWTKTAGPGTATFTAPTLAVTNVTFSLVGTYTLQLSAGDGALSTSDTVEVTVQPGGIVDRAIAASGDDAEEGPTSVSKTSTDLELVVDGTATQTVGLRFANLTIPAGSVIASAYVQFTCDEPTTTATQLTIAGQANDDAPTFATTAGSISSRPRTTATVAWTPASWTVADEAGPNQRTPNLASVVQEITNRPGWVSGNAMVIVITGTGRRIASAFDRGAAFAPRLVVEYQTVPASNQAPVVNAGSDVTTVITSAAHLAATVNDDGLPGGPVTIQWTKVSGPGTATFTAPTSAVTDVTFSETGTYTCQCSAFDGELTGTDTVVVTVTEAPVNQAPVVNAGADVTTVLTSSAQLSGTATDDGLPSGTLTIQWSKTAGPGTVTFTSPTQAVTSATFSLAGTYTLQLSAGDGALSTSDTVEVTVLQPPPGGTVDRAIAASGDDAEEGTTAVNKTSTDLEIVVDGTVTQTVGLRFADLAIPAGSFIASAHVQFTCDEATTTATQLTFAAQANDNAPTFATTAGNISSRPRTTATVAWTPASWTVANEAGPNQRTPNLASVVQEVVNRPGWASGNAMVFVVTGTGRRIASAFDRGASFAARLLVEYQTLPPSNQAPVVNAGSDVTTVITSAAHLAATVNDDGLPGGPVTIQWTQTAGPGTATFTAPTLAVTDVTFSLPGTYTCQCSAFDGELTGSDSIVITVQPPPVNQAPVVDAGPDFSTLLSAAATLQGSVADDGVAGPLTIQWTRTAGPGTATFTTPSLAVTDVTFSAPGTYTLELSANDTEFTRTDSVTVTVQAGVSIERAVAHGHDDAEELPDSVTRGGNDLEMVMDGTVQQVVGLRFIEIPIPAGAVITSAYVQFTNKEAKSEATQLMVAGQAADNPGNFKTTAANISSRPRTTAQVVWNPAPWTVVNEAGPSQRTPDLSSVLQEIVNRPGWTSGNAMVFVITGSGCRTGFAYDQSPTVAARLVVTYQ
ncbi:MAG TPA: hypothetical protein VF384_15900 [Planctomycetota bacterium]